jgi:leader peptidase (prepilin peptidase)/N-methyltransferase
MVILLHLFTALVGLAAGSFCNVLIHRLPREESVVSPPSHCPRCGAFIPWYLNVPVLSWVALLGRCRSCKAPISIRYPLVELCVGALFVASAWRWDFTPAALASAVFCLLITALSLIDLEHQILPDLLTYPGIVLGMVFCFFVPWTDWRSSLIGGIAGAGVPMFFIWLWPLLTGVEGMGWGDVKLLAMVGTFLGWKGLVLTLVAGSLSGAIVGGLYLWLSGRGGRTPLPFGTFLGIAALASLFFQDAVWGWYLGFLIPGVGSGVLSP